MGGDWNFFLADALDADGGTKAMKLSSISELIKIKEKIDLCDIFRVRHPNKHRFPFVSQLGQITFHFYFIIIIVLDFSVLVYHYHVPATTGLYI